MDATQTTDDLVLDTMRFAERAHRTRLEGPHYRKAPAGEDRPAYFIHLVEVGWMLQDAGRCPETVAAGYAHDVIEDCGMTRDDIARETGNERVAELVWWVSEDKFDLETGEERSWAARNQSYLERLRDAPYDARALSCADKTSNLRDMNRLLARGYPVSAFTSQEHGLQLRKFELLYDQVFAGHVPAALDARYRVAMDAFRRFGEAGRRT